MNTTMLADLRDHRQRRADAMRKLILLLALASSARIEVAAGEEKSRPGSTLTVNGTVVMPDGSPAADAVVTSRDGNDDPPTDVRTDARGRFRIQGDFSWVGCRLHARSADGKFQTTLRISEMLARKRLASPVEMKLLPAQERGVTVLAAGKPVEGASVVVGGLALFRSRRHIERRRPGDIALPGQ